MDFTYHNEVRLSLEFCIQINIEKFSILQLSILFKVQAVHN